MLLLYWMRDHVDDSPNILINAMKCMPLFLHAAGSAAREGWESRAQHRVRGSGWPSGPGSGLGHVRVRGLAGSNWRWDLCKRIAVGSL